MSADPEVNAFATKCRQFAMNGAAPAVEIRANETVDMARKHRQAGKVTAIL